MKRAEKAKLIVKLLNQYIPRPKIPLDHKNHYTLLIAVLLSAQTTDVGVNQVTPILFAKASTPKSMVKLTVVEIQMIIRSCGLAPRKARAIWELSKILLETHHGQVPDTFEELEALSLTAIQKLANGDFLVDELEDFFPFSLHPCRNLGL